MTRRPKVTVDVIWHEQAPASDLFNHAELSDGVFPPHQLAGLDFLLTHRKTLLADEVGLGKTVQTAALIAVLKQQGSLGQCLVLAPAHLVQQWVTELHRWIPALSVQDSASAARRSGGMAKGAGQKPDQGDVLVVSYEFARGLVAQLSQLSRRLVVLDEASALKGGGAEHAAVMALTRGAERVVALTATPFENDALETYQILRAMHLPDLWAQREFERRFLIWSPRWEDGYGRSVAPKPVGLVKAELPQLRAFLARYYLRRTAGELGLELPARVGDTIRWVPLFEAQRLALWRAGQLPAGLRRHQAREKACGVVGGRSSKAEAVVTELLGRPDEPKIVVWAFHKAHLDVMQGLLEEHGIGWVRIDGSITGIARATRLEHFEHESQVRVLLGTDVFGSGLNLQHARLMLSLGSSYNPGKEMQREGRIRRLGSTHATYEHITFLNDCAHERSKVAALLRKEADARAVFG